MYEEIQKRKMRKGIRGFISILLLVYGILLLMFLVGYIQTKFGINYLQYFLLAAIALLGFLIARRLLIQFGYVITPDGVEFRRKYGNKSKLILFVPYEKIVCFGKLADVREQLSGKKIRKITFQKEEENAFYILLSSEMIVFHPTELFEEKIREFYGHTNC